MAYLRCSKFVSRNFLRKGIFERLKKKAVFFNKSTNISYDFAVDRKVSVYNGMKCIGVFLRSNMVGHALGEFCFTKRMGSEIHSTTKKLKKRNKK